MCLKRTTHPTLCADCFDAYQETDGMDMLAVVAWAAERARRSLERQFRGLGAETRALRDELREYRRALED